MLIWAKSRFSGAKRSQNFLRFARKIQILEFGRGVFNIFQKIPKVGRGVLIFFRLRRNLGTGGFTEGGFLILYAWYLIFLLFGMDVVLKGKIVPPFPV